MEDGDDNVSINDSYIRENSTNIMGKNSEAELISEKNNDGMASNSQESDSSKVNCDKVNGEAEKIIENSEFAEDSLSDREDALVIDENPVKPKRKRFASSVSLTPFKGYKKRILAQASETLINNPNEVVESLSSGAQLSSTKPDSKINDVEISDDTNCNASVENKSDNDVEIIKEQPSSVDTVKCKDSAAVKTKLMGKKVEKLSINQKREYAQYLGLQPALKFKCSKCLNPNFTTLSALNEHIINCSGKNHVSTSKINSNSSLSLPERKVTSNSTTNFKISRKVYLCSSCGTYYENWQLFLHMREFHHRHICLLCLGLFSGAEKLSNHLIAKHNIVPTKYDDENEFLSILTGPAFIMCCSCEKVFMESDNFTEHICDLTNIKKATVKSLNVQKNPSPPNKQKQSLDINQQSVLTNNSNPNTVKPQNISTPKTVNSKPVVIQKTPLKSAAGAKQKKFLPSEHITGDTPMQKCTEFENASQEINDNISNLKLNETVENTVDDATNKKECSDNNTNEVLNELSQSTENTNSEQIGENTNAEQTVENTKSGDDDSALKRSDCENTEIGSVDTATEEHNLDKTEDSVLIDCEKKVDEEKLIDSSEFNENSTENKIESEESIENLSLVDCTDSQNNCDVGNGESISREGTAPKDEVNAETDSGSTNPIARNMSPIGSNSPRSEENVNGERESDEIVLETERDNRRVPKVTLKIPPRTKIIESETDSDDSCKLTMEIDDDKNNISRTTDELDDDDMEEKVDRSLENKSSESDKTSGDNYLVAGSDIPIIELGLRQPLEKEFIQELLKDFIRVTCGACVYCNHARKIAVNGKQLGLHVMAEHRFSGTVDSITAEELVPESFNDRIKECLSRLQSAFFNLESYDSENPESMIPYDRTYECFQCRFVTTVHKELYLHNRKMHQKTILLCIMCKSTFYSYSELLCHLCPGSYIGSEVKFRCCLCPSDNLPSAFRLMVHLRKRHHACDVCLETCNNQSKLSNHVWKHKLHHLCYRCGIAYRNKPDITKHLFWKHGTQSELCKRCLQKKWPHVYHFCIPPTSFVCDECNMNFNKAVALKVHKRLHNGVYPYKCTENNCEEKFISKKLLDKHILKHREPPPAECINPPTLETEADAPDENKESATTEETKEEFSVKTEIDIKLQKRTKSETTDDSKHKPIVDVFNLPALNLSESDSDESEEEVAKTKTENEDLNLQPASEKDADDIDKEEEASKKEPAAVSYPEENKPVPIVHGVWDDFQNYQAAKKEEKLDLLTSEIGSNVQSDTNAGNADIVLKDHDYCVVSQSPNEDSKTDETTKNKKDDKSGLDHDYCSVSDNSVIKNTAGDGQSTDVQTTNVTGNSSNKKNKSPKKKVLKRSDSSSSSDSSSDSDSSTSCTCGSNCSCSSSSGSSSSSSSSSDSNSSASENKKRISARKEKRLERIKNKKKTSETSAVDIIAEEPTTREPVEAPIYESDLYTEESETDEDFYDEHPHRLANKIIEEKKNLLIMEIGGPPSINGTFLQTSRTSTPNIPEEPDVQKTSPKKKLKLKSKKRKRNQKNRLSPLKPDLKQVNIPTYYEQPPVPQMNLTQQSVSAFDASSPMTVIPPVVTISSHIPAITSLTSMTLNAPSAGSGSETDSNLRLSKRRRVPNKFYGYSSDEETSVLDKTPAPPILKWNKADLPSPQRTPVVLPPAERQSTPSKDWSLKISVPDAAGYKPPSSSDSSASEGDSDDGRLHISQPPNYAPERRPIASEQPRPAENVYCYCQCPYDEVSEMIACDGKDCKIEWFHFECVGIMVPPKGKWFCPDCRKQSAQQQQQRSDVF